MKDELLAGRYQLERELGRGGMATVFLATDLRLARRVAVKVMHSGGDVHRAERFRREAELAASLKHPNVLEIHDFGEDPARGPFLVCEWVQGESLRALAERLSPVPAEVAAVLGWELARALAEAHAHGVVHRDVKPENVLVAHGGPLKLADFGIAALADQERLTSTGAITGSLPYMAPERIDTGAFSPASDVYAVGVILFELCTGTTPHGSKGSAHLAASVMTKDAPALSELVFGTPEPLEAAVARCLARDSRDRPADGSALTALLEGVVRQIAGPPAEESRAFFQEPEAYAARRREARFQSVLSEGRALLAKGEGARAAKALNAALALRPDSPEVLALLRQRPKVGRSRLIGGAALAGLVLVAGAGWGVHQWSTGSSPAVASTHLEQAPEAARDGNPAPAITAGQVPAPGERTQGSTPSPESGSAALPEAPPPGTGSGTKTSPGSTPEPSRATGVARSQGTASRQPVRMASRAEPRAEGGRTARGGNPQADVAGPPRDEAPVDAPRQAPAPVASASAESSLGTAAEPPPAAEPTKPATLKLMTRPWAEVFVDGQSRGYTPRVREVGLSPGSHRLRFVNPLCDAVEEVIEVSAGETLTREITLQVRKAEVAIIAPRGARIFIDRVEAGVAPLSGPVQLEHGWHVITAQVPGGAPLQREVEAVAGQRTQVVLEVTP